MTAILRTEPATQPLIQEELLRAKQGGSLVTSGQTEAYTSRIKTLLAREDAVLVAHYYTDPQLQELAEETGGCVSDSLEMARFGKRHEASTLVVAGVRFMG